ncbi:MAG: DUF2842 domain-containing protein [Parvularculaceae bacterium]
MHPRIKKLIGVPLVLALLIGWTAIAVTIADAIPDFWLAKLIYFIIAGIGWAAPTIPLLKWMNAAPKPQGDTIRN